MEGSSLVNDAWHMKQLYAAFVVRFISEGNCRNCQGEGEAGEGMWGGSKGWRGEENIERARRQW